MVFNEDQLRSVVKELAEKEGIKEPVINIQSDEKGKGFLGEIVLVDITDKKSPKQLNVVGKFAIKDETIRKIGNVTDAYENEINFYTKVVPELQKLQSNVTTVISLPTPKFYFASSVKGDELLILENLVKDGFKMLKMQYQLDHDHVTLILEKYAHIHGLSLALKTLEPGRFDEITSQLHHHYKHTIETHGEKLIDLFKNVYDSLDDVINPNEKETVKIILNNSKEIFNTILSGANDEFVTILHGDCWSNNNMFKYKITDGKEKLVDVKIFDWQACYKGPPVFDISYILYSGASKSILDNLNTYLQLYHDGITKVLKNFNLESNVVYPFEKLKEQWTKYSVFGSLMAAFILKMKYSKQEDIDVSLEDGDEYQKISENFSKAKAAVGFDDRIKELLQHLHHIKVFESYKK